VTFRCSAVAYRACPVIPGAVVRLHLGQCDQAARSVRSLRYRRELVRLPGSLSLLDHSVEDDRTVRFACLSVRFCVVCKALILNDVKGNRVDRAGSGRSFWASGVVKIGAIRQSREESGRSARLIVKFFVSHIVTVYSTKFPREMRSYLIHVL
jgi:hypothetical protein